MGGSNRFSRVLSIIFVVSAVFAVSCEASDGADDQSGGGIKEPGGKEPGGIEEPSGRTPLAEGGTVSWIGTEPDVYEIHTFTGESDAPVTAGLGEAAVFSFKPQVPVMADVLVVAGGGGGGGTTAIYGGGGGGAGGVISSASIEFGTEVYEVGVGKGGEGGAGNYPPGSDAANASNNAISTFLQDGKNGGDSWIQIAGLSAALGGGGGAKTALNISVANSTGKNGGSGGGGTYLGPGGKGLEPQGFPGGTATSNRAAAGGGGAGAAAANAGKYQATNGGEGVANDITGTSVFYGGGGAGGKTNTDGVLSSATGGLGGGGDSGNPGVDGTGGGGGGGCGDGTTQEDLVKRIGSKGGDGIVIIRFPWTAP